MRSKKKSKKSQAHSIIKTVKGQKVKYTIGFFLVLLGIYLLIAFISFFFYGAADHSQLDISWRELFTTTSSGVHNKTGKLGAILSEFFVNRGFGIASFLFIYFIIAGASHFFGKPLMKFYKLVISTSLLLISISLTVGLILIIFKADNYQFLSGDVGLYFANWMCSIFGRVGSCFILLGCLFLTLLLKVNSFIPFLQKLGNIRFKRKMVINPVSDLKAPKLYSKTNDVETLSKLIDENDGIKTVFDPDGDIDFDEELDVEIIERPVRVKEDHIVTPPVQKPLNPEMSIEKIEEDDNFIPAEGLEPYDPTLDLSDYKFPTLDLLDDHVSGNAEVSNEELISNKNRIVETLRHYKIEITKIRATIGPTITLYEIIPAPGVRIAKIKNLEDDIALSLSALGIRIIAPIPGRGTIGIEVPNRQPEVVSMRSIIASKKFQESTADLPVVLGKTISNETFLIDLVKMPHILVAGATGQGKSVGLNAIIASLLYKKHPSQLKFVMIDPKKVELSLYSIIEKHFLAKLPDDEEPIITDIQKVKNTLSSLNIEMDNRYDLLKKAHARNLKEYNVKFIERRLNPEKGHRFFPYIVVIIDEFADLIMTAGKEIELPIARIAQLARAVGIHMVIATQRPSINIITGVIKANFPTRIAFKVASMIDSRTILDTPGANQLIGKGDMLISMGSTMTRLQCAFVDTPEVERVCEFISRQRGYPSAFMLPEYAGDSEDGALDVDLKDRDQLFDDAARLVVLNQQGSTSMIQRKFSIGYNRAGRIMDQLEAAGIVGPVDGSKPRQVLIHDEYTLEQLLNNL